MECRIYKNIAIFTKTSIFSSKKVTCRKAGKKEGINPKKRVLNKKCCQWGKKNSKKRFTISQTQHRASAIPTPISTNRKELEHGKKRSPTLEARSKNQKNQEKFKINHIKLNYQMPVKVISYHGWVNNARYKISIIFQANSTFLQQLHIISIYIIIIFIFNI